MRVSRVLKALPLIVLVSSSFAVADASAESLLDRAARRVNEIGKARMPEYTRLRDDVRREAEGAHRQIRDEVLPDARRTADRSAQDLRATAERARDDAKDIAEQARIKIRGNADQAGRIIDDAADRLVNNNRKMLCNLLSEKTAVNVSKMIEDGKTVEIPAAELKLATRISSTRIRLTADLKRNPANERIRMDWLDNAGNSLVNAATSLDDLMERYALRLDCYRVESGPVIEGAQEYPTLESSDALGGAASAR